MDRAVHMIQNVLDMHKSARRMIEAALVGLSKVEVIKWNIFPPPNYEQFVKGGSPWAITLLSLVATE
jgi:hypothetical protein